jgi:inosine-uridine nucleoside N-ribohydrolase
MTSTDSTTRDRGGGAGGKESDGSGDDGKESPQLAAGFNIWWDSMDARTLFNASNETAVGWWRI